MSGLWTDKDYERARAEAEEALNGMELPAAEIERLQRAGFYYGASFSAGDTAGSESVKSLNSHTVLP